MPVRIRMGPFGASSRGSFGVRAGPVSAYTRGRRRSGGGSGAGWGLLVVLAGVATVVYYAVRYWYFTIPGLLVLGWLGVRASRKSAERQQQRLAAEEAVYQEWLRNPAPPLPLPGSFTPNWFARDAPSFHPGHIKTLEAELPRRGWGERRIRDQARPYYPVFDFTSNEGAARHEFSLDERTASERSDDGHTSRHRWHAPLPTQGKSGAPGDGWAERLAQMDDPAAGDR
jgi:hypothetical protein